MPLLLDTNILVRLANAADALHQVATHAVLELHRRGEGLHITAQNLVEFRGVATRPSALNGLGLSGAATEAKAAVYEATFQLAPDIPSIYPAWKSLVNAVGIVGKQVHDARLVAVCHAHKIDKFLTFDIRHFTRLASYGPGLVLIDPATV